jgi:hypothetical protein
MHQPPSSNLYANNDTRSYMVDFIKEHFTDLLGPHAALLDQPGGLDTLADMMRKGEIGRRRGA